jgi:hypothetical protein
VNYSYDPRLRQPSRLALHISRIVVDAGVLLVLGSMSLPFVTAEAFRQRAVAGDALPALFLVVPVFIMTLLPDQSRPLPAPLAWASLALAGAALPYTVVKYLDASTLAGTLQGTVGIGARILVMGTFVVLAGLALGLIRGLFHTPEAAPFPDEEAAGALASTAAPSRARPASAAGAVSGAGAASPAGRPGPATGSGVPQPQPTVAAARGAGAPPTPTSRAFPRWRRPAAAAAQPPAGPSSPPRAANRPPARVPARTRQTDPDTEPTLPAQRPVQPWWPDDLEDLFS